MAKKEKTPPKKPAINSYWLYASIILFFIGMSFFGGSDGMSSDQKINISAFENYLNDGEVSKVVVVNKKTAQVTLTETALTETKHSRPLKRTYWVVKTAVVRTTNLRLVTSSFSKRS